MTVLFLKYVPRKYKLDNDHFPCSGENATETRGTAQGARNQDSPRHELHHGLHAALSLTLLQLCKVPQYDTKTLPIEKLQLGLKTDRCWYFKFKINL